MRARLKQLKHAKIWYIKSQNGFFLCFYFAFFYLLYHLIWVMTFTWWCIKQQKRLCYTRCGVEMENGFDSVRVMIEALFFSFGIFFGISAFMFFFFSLPISHVHHHHLCVYMSWSIIVVIIMTRVREREAHCAAHS